MVMVESEEAEVQIDGVWWIPGKKTKQAQGRLFLYAERHLELEALGGLGLPLHQSAPLQVVLGQGADGAPYTLEGCHRFRGTGKTWRAGQGFVGFRTSRIRVLRVYKGLSSRAPHKTRVDQVNIELDYVADWWNPQPLRFESGKGGDDWAYRHRRVQPLRFRMPDAAMVSLWALTTEKIGPGQSVDIPVHCEVVVKFPKPQTLRQAEFYVHGLQFFFAFATGKDVQIRRMRYRPNGSNEFVDELSSRPGALVADALYFFAKPGFPYQEVKTRLGSILRRWMRMWNDAREVVSLLATDIYGGATYPEPRFLTLATALEAFHRWQCEATKKKGPRKKYGKKGAWNMKDRIDDLWAPLSKTLDPLVVDPPNTRQRMVDVRDYYSHYLRPREGGIKKPKSQEEVQSLIRVGRVLLHLSFMRELGMTKKRMEATAKYWLIETGSYVLPGWPI